MTDHASFKVRMDSFEKALDDHMKREESELSDIAQTVNDTNTKLEVFIATANGWKKSVDDEHERLEDEVKQLRNNWNRVFWGVLTAVGGGFTMMFTWFLNSK